MGRHLCRNQSTLQFDQYYGGCIWGLLPLHFHSFKKLMPSIRLRHERPSKSGLKTQSEEPDEGQIFEVGNSDSSYTATENSGENISLLASKEDSKVPQRPRLLRTYSIHHLELPSNYLDDSNIDHKQPVVIHKVAKASASELHHSLSSGEVDKIISHLDLLGDGKVAWNSKHFGEQDVLDHEAVAEYQFSSQSESSSETHEDFFDAFQIDKKLFIKNTRKLDADDSDQCQGVVKYHNNVMLRRSVSLPTTNKSCSRYGSLAPSKLESKVTEVWPSSLSSSCSSSSSSPSFRRLENLLPRSHSMVCKLPLDIFGELKTEKSFQDEFDHGAADYASNVKKYKLRRIRRASSLNESLERYTQLFETHFRRDAKLNLSKSLKLSNEDEVGFNLSDSAFLRKAHSLREASLQIQRSDSIEFSKVRNKSARLSSDASIDESRTFDPTILEAETGFVRSNVAEECASSMLEFNQGHDSIKEDDNTSDIINQSEDSYYPEKDIDFTRKGLDGEADHNSYSLSESARDEDESCAGFQKQLGCSCSLESRLLAELQTKPDFDPDSDSLQHLKAEHIEAALNQLGVLGTRLSLHRSTELNYDIEEQLLSDIVNEAVLDVCDGCDAYWPTPLCLNCHMHPAPPTEHHVAQKTQSRIHKLQSFSLKNSNTVDSVMAYDLAQNDDWMNLQTDAESLGLALDEIIFDELIEELMYE